MTTTTTLRIDASRYTDSDDCLAAAAADVARERGLTGWDLSPRWEDEQRDVILLDVPTTDILTAASQIAGAAWDDRGRTGTLAEQLRTVAGTPALGTDGDLTDEDRQALRDLAEQADTDA